MFSSHGASDLSYMDTVEQTILRQAAQKTRHSSNWQWQTSVWEHSTTKMEMTTSTQLFPTAR